MLGWVDKVCRPEREDSLGMVQAWGYHQMMHLLGVQYVENLSFGSVSLAAKFDM